MELVLDSVFCRPFDFLISISGLGVWHGKLDSHSGMDRFCSLKEQFRILE